MEYIELLLPSVENSHEYLPLLPFRLNYGLILFFRPRHFHDKAFTKILSLYGMIVCFVSHICLKKHMNIFI